MTTPPSRTPLRMLLLSMTLALAKNSSCPSLTTMSTRGCTDLCQDEAVVCMFYSNVEDCTDNLLGQCIQDSSNNCSVKCMKTNFWGGLIFEIPTDTIMDTVGSMDSNFLTRLYVEYGLIEILDWKILKGWRSIEPSLVHQNQRQ